MHRRTPQGTFQLCLPSLSSFQRVSSGKLYFGLARACCPPTFKLSSRQGLKLPPRAALKHTRTFGDVFESPLRHKSLTCAVFSNGSFSQGAQLAIGEFRILSTVTVNFLKALVLSIVSQCNRSSAEFRIARCSGQEAEVGAQLCDWELLCKEVAIRMARVRARRLQGNGMLYMLAVHAVTKFMQLPRKPPVTAVLIAVQTLIHLRPGMLNAILPTISEVCLNPYLIIQDWDLKRLWLSAFYHVDDTHLVYNMISLLWKGAQLENAVGSQRFAVMVAVLLGLSHGLVVASSSLLSFLADSPTSFYSNCSVGFSGVLFALKVVLNYNSSSHTSVYGILVPSRYAAWVELLVIQMFVPGTSFLGHLCGILAGVVYMNTSGAISGSLSMGSVVPTILGVISWPLRSLGWFLGGPRHRTYGRGTVGSRRDTHSPPRGGHEADVWRCQSCTYDNSIVVEACDMCGTLRGIEARPEVDDFSPSAPPISSWRPSSQMEELRLARLSRFNR